VKTIDAMEETLEGDDEAWEKSESKALLRSGLLSGEITPAMKPLEIHRLHPEAHGKWRYPNWSNNLRNLRVAVERDTSRMQRDAISYGHDLAMVKSSREAGAKPVWHRSSAPALLKKDVDDGKHKQLKPAALYASRPEYQVFDLSVFRKHIYQEADSRPKREYRFEKKKKGWKYPELHKDHPRLQDGSNG
jgi:hypothetical protein